MTSRALLHRPPALLVAVLLTAGALTVVEPPRAGWGATAALRALPASEAASPAVLVSDDGRQDIFSRSSAGRLTQQYLLPGGSWRRPLDRTGSLASQPVVVSWGPGRTDAFARGTDNTLQHRWSTGAGWSGWESLGGSLTSAPAVASWGPGRLDVFIRGANNAMFHRSYVSGTGWSGWTNRGGVLTSSPAAASVGPGRLDVVVRGGDNRGYLKSYGPAGWSGWQYVGGAMTSQPAAASAGTGHLDLAVRSTDNRIWVKSRTATGWTGWAAVGTTTHASGAGMGAAGSATVMVTKRDNGYFYRSVRSSPSSAWGSWRIVDQYAPLRGLATWVDVLDYPGLDPATAVPDMAARGVRTLFLATARFNSAADFYDQAEMGQWLDRAHAAGITVVGWYVPAYGDMTRDVRRVVAINDYASPGGQRFDAVGIDIERFGTSGEVNRATFNARVVPHLQQVRAKTSAPMVSIVPTPFTTNAGNNWEGFPWSGIGPNSEVVVPMTLWTFRRNSNGTAYSAAQVSTYVTNEIDRTQALTGRRIHVEGGVLGEPATGGTPFTTDRLQAFVNASKAAGVIGGSNYDYATFNGTTATNRNTWWGVLRGFNT